jgi:coenzyme F420 biosynthesis associated uncharacterized protein
VRLLVTGGAVVRPGSIDRDNADSDRAGRGTFDAGLADRGPVDWSAAVRSGQRLAPTGPKLHPDEAAAVVADLRAFSGRAELAVRHTTGLGAGLPLAAASVVDRARWIEATAAGMAELAAPLSERLAAKLPSTRGRTFAGSQLGVVLGFLSGKVLGQYDPLTPDGDGRPGTLLLVAPNIVKVERELEVDSADFRMWVCLHEGTHRLQFTAVPWLRDHFRGLVADFAVAADVDPSDMLKRMADAIRGGRRGESWIETIQTEDQRAVFDRIMALMTLLEGHADHVMDAVGPGVVPSVAVIRGRFSERRRRGAGPIDRLLRALLGMDVKLAQYVKGAAFVDGVVDRIGMEGFNAVWTSPDTLPTRTEITDPMAWVARVHG